MSAWDFILATLALWRLCRMIVYEDGPAFIFQRIRIRIGIIETEDEIQATNWIALLFTCPLCVSVWFSIPFILLLGGGWLEWLALSGATSTLFRFTDR